MSVVIDSNRPINPTGSICRICDRFKARRFSSPGLGFSPKNVVVIVRESSQRAYDSDLIVSWFARFWMLRMWCHFFTRQAGTLSSLPRVNITGLWFVEDEPPERLPPSIYHYTLDIWFLYDIYIFFIYILYVHLYIQHSQLLHQTILDVLFPSSWSKGGIPIVMRLFTTFPAGLGKPQMVVNYESAKTYYQNGLQKFRLRICNNELPRFHGFTWQYP